MITSALYRLFKIKNSGRKTTRYLLYISVNNLVYSSLQSYLWCDVPITGSVIWSSASLRSLPHFSELELEYVGLPLLSSPEYSWHCLHTLHDDMATTANAAGISNNFNRFMVIFLLWVNASITSQKSQMFKMVQFAFVLADLKQLRN